MRKKLQTTDHRLPTARGGYTLVELVIYAAVLGIISILVVQGALSTTRTFAELRAANNVRAAASVALERLLKEIRFAEAIDYGASTLGVHPGRLTLRTSDEAGVPKTVEFSVATGTLRFVDGGLDKGALTGSGVTVSSLIFREATTTKGSLVKIEMTLTDTRPTNQKSANFYASAVLRGSY